MAVLSRKLNDIGISHFSKYIEDGAKGTPPKELLFDDKTTDRLSHEIELGELDSQDRYLFGKQLKTILDGFNSGEINIDKALWSSLALYWFDDLRLRDNKGNIKSDPGEEYRFILSSSHRHYYRHLVRTPWRLVTDYGEAARLLLISPSEKTHPFSYNGEILEHIIGRRDIGQDPIVIQIANELYFDKKTNRPKRSVGTRDSSQGGISRLGKVMKQLVLTYDPEVMGHDEYINNILPNEFDQWKT